MEGAKIISGSTPEAVWQQIEKDFSESPNLFEYNVIIEQHSKRIALDIDIDLGGGFENGYAYTRFAATLKNFDDLRFSLHQQDFLDRMGKFLGMQDVELGYSDFDHKIVVKTNHPERLKDIFSDSHTRKTLLSISEFAFHIGHHISATQVESAYLELTIEEGITNPERLREIYTLFITVLDKVELNGPLLRYINSSN